MAQGKHTGKVLDERYRLLDLLGEGGMGTVYLAEHLALGRRVAVKILHLALTRSTDVVTRFYREAKASTAIEHPNIIDVFDVGTAPWGEPYMVMEYLKGENLSAHIKRHKPMSFSSAGAIAGEALDGLSAAHDAGIVHRDLKPENIFLLLKSDKQISLKLIDFGISKFTFDSDENRLTRTGSMIGTPSHMSPEQARGRGNVDHRADLYTLGVIIFEMITGELPFTGENYNDLLVNILTEPAKTPSSLVKNIEESTEKFIMRAIDRNPDKRFQSAREMKEALEEICDLEEGHLTLAKILPDEATAEFATGDLGSIAGRDPFSAPTVLITDDGGPTRVVNESELPLGRRSSRASVVIIAAALLLAAGVFAFLFSSSSSNPSQEEIENDSDAEVLKLQAELEKVEKEKSQLTRQYNKKLEQALLEKEDGDEISKEGQEEIAAESESKEESIESEGDEEAKKEVATSGAVDNSEPKKEETQVETEKPKTEEKKPTEKEETEKESTKTPTPYDEPLTASYANRQFDKKSYLVRACYDREDTSENGEIKMLIEITESGVSAKVQKNDLTKSLAYCVKKVVEAQKFDRFIEEPVMFEKVYTFKAQ